MEDCSAVVILSFVVGDGLRAFYSTILPSLCEDEQHSRDVKERGRTGAEGGEVAWKINVPPLCFCLTTSKLSS